MAKASGLSEKSIRYYERMGLLQVERKENGYREYYPEDIERLQEIALFRSLYASIEDIKKYYELHVTLDQFLSTLLVKQQESINSYKEAIAFTKKMQLHHDETDFSLLSEFVKRKRTLGEYTEMEAIELNYLSKGKQGKRNILLMIIVMLSVGFLFNTDFNKEVVMSVTIVTLAIMVLILLFPAIYEFIFRIIKMMFRLDSFSEICEKKWIKVFPNAYLRWFMKILLLVLFILMIMGIVYRFTC